MNQSQLSQNQFHTAQQSTPYPVPFIDVDDLHWAIYERISEIQDPEFNQTLEELEVLESASLVVIPATLLPLFPPSPLIEVNPSKRQQVTNSPMEVHVVFKPTVPHCSYASLIGLCLIYTIHQVISEFNFTPSPPDPFINPKQNDAEGIPIKMKDRLVKITILLQPGSHQQETELNKQFNDKERIIAAFDNPTLLHQVQKLCNRSNQH